jgi:hypothetical protein
MNSFLVIGSFHLFLVSSLRDFRFELLNLDYSLIVLLYTIMYYNIVVKDKSFSKKYKKFNKLFIKFIIYLLNSMNIKIIV